MKLTIQNYNKVEGILFKNRFELISVAELDDEYEFVFSDNKELYITKHTFWLSRYGDWDCDDRKWYYKFRNTGVYVSADYFHNMDNVYKVFVKFLESC